jgi:hypothetical protein
MCQHRAVMSRPLCQYTATCVAVVPDLPKDACTRQDRERLRRAPGKTGCGQVTTDMAVRLTLPLCPIAGNTR